MTRISAQIAIYPLQSGSAAPAVSTVLAALDGHGLTPDCGPMSTVVTGDLTNILEALQDAFAEAAGEGRVVMTITLSNACPTAQE